MESKETIAAYLSHTADAAESICDSASAHNSEDGSESISISNSNNDITNEVGRGSEGGSEGGGSAGGSEGDLLDEQEDDQEQEDDFDSSQHELAKQLLTSPHTRSLISQILSGTLPLPSPPPHPYPTPTQITRPDRLTTYPTLHRQIQRYITSFQYNHTGLPPFFKMRKDRGMKHVVNICKQIIKEGLPIQCVEAVFLGVYLTMNSLKFLSKAGGGVVPPAAVAIPVDDDDPPPSPKATALSGLSSGCRRYAGVLRLPISFKTSCNGNIYRHIVLAIYAHTGLPPSPTDSAWRWGALGISRRKTLMFKEMKYSTLGKLIKTFKDSYEASWHAVIKVNIGLPFSYDSEDVSRLYWKLKKVNIEDKEWKDCEEIFDSYSRECVGVYDYFAYNGKLPEMCTEEWIRGDKTMKDVRNQQRKSQIVIVKQAKGKAKSKKKKAAASD
ncbi:hypothetical protein TrST_g4345 [Triparma strigata]|uniref:Uncharacterized protein n=1 Tax=Triparma strigata TaxID=1606541 RepID=A0A9W7B756_9STRA|nr:hypothetical protein TrST_g4345 [Triparma strigata]